LAGDCWQAIQNIQTPVCDQAGVFYLKYICIFHGLYNTSNTVALSNLGFDLKMGYEKKLTKTSTIDLGPIINFSDQAFFDKATNQQFKNEKYRPYQYYVGFDVAFAFDVIKK
jgi:hypothetical protein